MRAGVGRAHQETERRGRGEELQKDEVAVQELHDLRRSGPQPEFLQALRRLWRSQAVGLHHKVAAAGGLGQVHFLPR